MIKGSHNKFNGKCNKCGKFDQKSIYFRKRKENKNYSPRDWKQIISYQANVLVDTGIYI